MRRFPLRVAPASAGSFRATIGMPDPVACVPAAASSGGAGNMGGTDDIGNHEDDGAGTLIDLPFTVKLYSLVYSAVRVGANGVLTFAGFHPTTGANTSLGNGSFGACIFPLWSPLRTDLSRMGVFTATIGEPGSRAFVIEWRAAQESGGTANFAVTFYEGSESFDFTYGRMDPVPTAFTIGVQKDGGSPAHQYAYNEPGVLAAGLRLRVDYVSEGSDYVYSAFNDAVYSNGTRPGPTSCPSRQSLRIGLRLQ